MAFDYGHQATMLESHSDFTLDVAPLQKAFLTLAAKVRTLRMGHLHNFTIGKPCMCSAVQRLTRLTPLCVQVDQCTKENAALRAELAELKVRP